MNDIINEIKYFKKPKSEDVSQLIEEVINIGHGIYGKKTSEKDFEISKKEALQNKKQWKEISENNSKIAMYNPYIKENFKKMSALDIYRAFAIQIKESANNDYKIPSDEFTQNLENTKAELIKAFEESGIEPRNYCDFLERFDADCNFAVNIYNSKNAEYTYGVVVSKNSEDLSYLLENKNTAEEIKQTANKKISECLSLGIPKNDIIDIVFHGFEYFVTQNDDSADLDFLTSVIKDLDIEGKKLTEIIPNCDKLIAEMAERAMRTFSEIQTRNSDTEFFVIQQNKLLSLKEFLFWYKENKNAYPDDIDKIITNLIQKYNIQDKSYLFSVLQRKSLLKNFQKINPFVLALLERNSLNGSLQVDDIETALLNGFISAECAARYLENSDKTVKPEVLKFEMSFDDDVFKENAEYVMKRTLITIDLGYGNISLSEAEKRLKSLVEDFEKEESI